MAKDRQTVSERPHVPASKSGMPGPASNQRRECGEMGTVAKVAGKVGAGRMPSSEHPYGHEEVHGARNESKSEGLHASHAGHHGHAHETGSMTPHKE